MSLFKSIFGKGPNHKSTKDAELILELQGTVAYEEGQISKSIEIYSQGIKKYSSNPYFYYLRGNAKEDLKDWDGAISDFSKYLEINKNHYNALFRIGLCYQNSQRYDAALRYYNKAEENYEMFMTIVEEIQMIRSGDTTGSYFNIPKEKIHSNRAIVKINLGDSEGAINDCNIAIKINPNYPNPYFIRGIEYLKKNNKVSAKTDLTKASQLGYSQADQLIKQYFSNDENDEFYNQVKVFAESEQSLAMTGGTRLRVGFESDLRSNLMLRGSIPTLTQKILIDEAVDYTVDMWNEFSKQSGEIDDVIKAFVAYEVSQAFKNIRPDIEQNNFWMTIFEESYKK